jgi:hypothetical protein
MPRTNIFRDAIDLLDDLWLLVPAASDITAVMDSLKALDLEWPIREAEVAQTRVQDRC